MLRKRQKNDLYCQFLIAAQTNYTVTELSDRLGNIPAHDSFTKWLETDHLTPKLLWNGLKESVDLGSGDFILDHTVFDKWYAKNMDLVYRQYSGTHHREVDGIGLTTLLWYSHYQHIPVNFRLYDPKTDGKTRHDHSRNMLQIAHGRGFKPGWVIMDAEFSAVDNLKLINSFGWRFLTGVRKNRLICFVKRKHHHVSDIPIPEEGVRVWLKDYGVVKVFKLVRHQRIDYLVTNDVTISSSDVEEVYARRWEVELYHRGLKQVTGVAKCQAQSGRVQRNHIVCSIRVFLSLEKEVFKRGLSWYELPKQIIEGAITTYLRGPTIPLVAI